MPSLSVTSTMSRPDTRQPEGTRPRARPRYGTHCGSAPDRIAHVHLKDVNEALAARVRSGELTYTQAVAKGMCTPLGQGDIDTAKIVTSLRGNGFDGWFVLEQDTVLTAEPLDEGPVRDVMASVSHLQAVLAHLLV